MTQAARERAANSDAPTPLAAPASPVRAPQPSACPPGPVVASGDVTTEWAAALAVAVEHLAEGLVITGLDGRIEYVNPAFERMCGYTRAELYGQNPRLLKSGSHDATFYRELWETLRRGETWRGRFINRRKDGRLYHEEASISPIRDLHGRNTKYVAAKRDVTREVALETQLRESQKMQALGQLAGGVAHEFNNLLTTILAASETLGGQAPPALAVQTARIQKAAQRAAILVRGLLAVGGRHVARPRTLDLNEVVRATLDRFRETLGPRIAVQQRLTHGGAHVRVDPELMDQLLTNLVLNARDAMSGGGTLTLKTATVELRTAADAGGEPVGPGRYVVLSVHDTGRGMDAATRARLFEPFFTTKGVGDGTGLGLATARGIVHQHGGRIVAHSVPGRGTTFEVYLPQVADQPDSEPVHTVPVSRRAASRTILLVEDEEEVREVTREILVAEGYNVLTATDGHTALALCRAQGDALSLLITDVVMPGMSGCELARQVAHRVGRLPVLCISGCARGVFGTVEPLPPGAAFLSKPFTRAALTAKVCELLRRPSDALADASSEFPTSR